MSEHVVRRNSSAGASADPSDDDDDTISLTSTVPDAHDPDKEFVVDDVLAEMPSQTGEPSDTRYLIRWEGFGLHECTWEPEDNLGPELKAMWEEKKQKCANGEEKAFDVETFYEAQRKASEEKAERHRSRNAKRQRKGLPLTPPVDDESNDDELEMFYEESAKKLTAKEAHEKAAAASNKDKDKVSWRKADKTEKRPESRRESIPKSPATEDKPPASKKPALNVKTSNFRIPSDRPSSISYQGTARKLSGTSPTIDDVAGKAKTAAASQGSAPSPAQKATAGTLKSTLKAKKSAPKKPAGTNIFTGGKVRKQRLNLQQAMSDPSKEKKHFNNLRTLRLAEKRGRDMEDLPISFESVIPLNGHVPSRANSNEAMLSNPVASTPSVPGKVPSRANSYEAMSPNPITRTPSVDLTLKSAIAPSSRDEGPSKKKRKSVRWVEDEESMFVEEPEPMDMDSAVPAPPSKPVPRAGDWHPRLKSPPPPVSSDQARSNLLVQSQEKRVVVGNSAEFTATFDGIPREPAQPWISSFMTHDLFEFRHTCFSKTINRRVGDLIPTHFQDGTINVAVHGTITSSAHDSKLESIANYLRAGLLGLYTYYAQSRWSVIVYPTKCDDWKEVWPGQEPAPASGVALCYAAFHSARDYRPFLRPFGAQSTLSGSVGTGSSSARQTIMSRLFKFDYEQLLPKRSKLPAAHGFFLAFPPSREESKMTVYHWLRDCNPACFVYSSENAGAWAAFWENIRDHRFRGAVIVHETLVPSLFRFPTLAQNLIRGLEEYWCFSESSQAEPIYQSISPTYREDPGAIGLTRLFPARTVIFITPSFLVSEPRRAYEFFSWYLDWAGEHCYRLVTAWNIHEYLTELADEKAQERDELETRRVPSHEIAIESNLRRLDRETCDFRYRTAALALELQTMRMKNAALYGLQDFDDDESPLIYADSSIDPNDEQSLVNWFGWWTTMRLDQYRKFHILGSSPVMKLDQRKFGERRIRLPKYVHGTVNEPDAVLEALRKKEMELEQSAGSTGSRAEEEAKAQVAPSRNGLNLYAFQSDRLKNEGELQACLDTIIRSINCPAKFLPWVLYKFPVSWLDLEMASRFGDSVAEWAAEHKMVPKWFRFTWGFTGRNPNFNTYIGFFYTIVEDWDPKTTPRCHKPQRQPWLLFYRPVNPHKKPKDGYQHQRLEIIIWDPLAKTRVGSRAPTEKDLLDMQRRVVQFIRENTDQKNPGSWIDQVWLGGFEYPPSCESPYPIDLTLSYLEAVLADIKDHLPAPEHLLPERGFRKVKMEADDDRGDPMDMDIDDDLQDQESDDEEANESRRIIFHPPRATRLSPGQRTQCTNKLYEEARLARAHAADGGAVVDITYSFPPTEEWYGQQRREGRSFEHINVQSWENIFNIFKIGTSKKVSEGSTADDSSVAGSPASL
ncbi:chromo domain containing protein [Rhypophila decipiens]